MESGRWRRCAFSTVNSQFFISTVLKGGNSWFYAVSVHYKGSKISKDGHEVFERFCILSVSSISQTRKSALEDGDTFNLKKLFSTLFCACYAADVISQYVSVPAGTGQEKKRNFNDKHHFCGCGKEVFALRNELTVHFRRPRASSVVNIKTFRKICNRMNHFVTNLLIGCLLQMDMSWQTLVIISGPFFW